MPQRLPNFGESPYYNILVPWLRLEHAADGTHGAITSTSLTTSGILSATLSQAHRIGSGSDFVAPTNNAWTLAVSGVIVPGLGQPGYGFISAPNFTKHSSGTHSQFVNAEIDFPHITNPGAGSTVTDLVALRLGADGAPAGATNMWAIQVMNGANFLGGAANDVTKPGAGLNNSGTVSWKDAAGVYSNAAFLQNDSSNRFLVGVGGVARASWDASGTLCLNGTTFGSLGGAAGRLVQGNNTGHYWIDASGGATNAMFLIGNSSNGISFGTGNATRLILTGGGGLLFSDTDPGFANANGRFTMRNNTHHFWIDAAGGATNAMFVTGDSSNSLVLGTGNTTRVTITQGGQVQLGTDVKFGTNTAKGAEAFASFITITDAAGNSRKLMVCA